MLFLYRDIRPTVLCQSVKQVIHVINNIHIIHKCGVSDNNEYYNIISASARTPKDGAGSCATV